MEMSVDVDSEISKNEGKELEIEDQTGITKTEIKKECELGEMKRDLPDSLYKEFIGFGGDDKVMKQEYVKEEAKEDFQTSIKTEIKEECTIGKNKRKLLEEDVKVEMKEEYVEEEINEFPDSLPKIEIEMDKEHFDLPKKARKMGKNKECPSHQQIDENTFETEKKWILVPFGYLFIVKCPECQYEEIIKNTNDINQFSFHMKTRTAQGYTRSHPCSICSINLKVDELIEHMRIHRCFCLNFGFWNLQQHEWVKKDKWCVQCPLCPSTKYGTRVKICKFPQHIKKTHGSFMYVKMNSEKGALGCRACGDSKVILTNIERHIKCMESQNNKGTHLDNNNSKDVKLCQDENKGKMESQNNKSTHLDNNNSKDVKLCQDANKGKMESQNNKGTQLDNNNSKDVKLCQDANKGEMESQSNKGTELHNNNSKDVKLCQNANKGKMESQNNKGIQLDNNNSKDVKLFQDANKGKQIEKETSKKNTESESDDRITDFFKNKGLFPSSQINKVTGPADENEPSGHLGNNRCSSGDEASKYSDYDVASKYSDCDEMVKLVLVVRQDLKMSKEKVMEECCNATLASYELAVQKCPEMLRAWKAIRQPKSIVEADNEEVLLTVLAQARSLGLVSAVVEYAEYKQIMPGTKTVVAVGPGPVDLVDQVTGALENF